VALFDRGARFSYSMKYWPHKAVVLAGIVVLGVSVASAAEPSSSTRQVSKNSKSAHHSSKKPRKPRARGQQAIDGERCREIQQALVRERSEERRVGKEGK